MASDILSDLDIYVCENVMCRLCGCIGNNISFILLQESCYLVDIIAKETRVRIRDNDIFPRTICRDCVDKVRLIQHFRDHCRKTQNILQKTYNVEHGAKKEPTDDTGMVEEWLEEEVINQPKKIITQQKILTKENKEHTNRYGFVYSHLQTFERFRVSLSDESSEINLCEQVNETTPQILNQIKRKKDEDYSCNTSVAFNTSSLNKLGNSVQNSSDLNNVLLNSPCSTNSQVNFESMSSITKTSNYLHDTSGVSSKVIKTYPHQQKMIPLVKKYNSNKRPSEVNQTSVRGNTESFHKKSTKSLNFSEQLARAKVTSSNHLDKVDKIMTRVVNTSEQGCSSKFISKSTKNCSDLPSVIKTSQTIDNCNLTVNDVSKMPNSEHTKYRQIKVSALKLNSHIQQLGSASLLLSAINNVTPEILLGTSNVDKSKINNDLSIDKSKNPIVTASSSTPHNSQVQQSLRNALTTLSLIQIDEITNSNKNQCNMNNNFQVLGTSLPKEGKLEEELKSFVILSKQPVSNNNKNSNNNISVPVNENKKVRTLQRNSTPNNKFVKVRQVKNNRQFLRNRKDIMREIETVKQTPNQINANTEIPTRLPVSAKTNKSVRIFKSDAHKYIQKILKKGYKCTICDEIFQYPFKAAMHVRKHTGEKPFICKHCPRSFISGFFLLKHEKTHLTNVCI